jgi:hypothetical protein
MTRDGSRGPTDSRSGAEHELDELVLQLKALVKVRARLESGGASAAEIESYTVRIDRVRARLAIRVQEGGDGYGAAA